jgi:hypothetical protein
MNRQGTTISQCLNCRRYFVDGEVVSVSFGEVAAAFRAGQMEQQACGREDCAAVVAENARADETRRNRRLERRRARGGHAQRSTLNAQRSSCPPEAPLPRRSVQGPDAADGTPGTHVETVSPSQADFEASGAAANQNAKLIEFFSDPRTHGKMWPMVYLQEISGAQRMNNRAIDLRRHFKPLGFGLWNEMRPYGPTGALHSHYGLFTLEEIELKEAAWADEQEKRRGQEQLV